jgi:hypothetical protein
MPEQYTYKKFRGFTIESNTQYFYDFILSPYIPRDKKELDFALSNGTHRIIEKSGMYYSVEKPDPLSFWYLEHRDLSFAVMLWEMASKNDLRLESILEWHENERQAYIYRFPRDKLDDIDFGRFGKDKKYTPDFILLPHRIENYHPQKLNAKKAVLSYIQQVTSEKIQLYPLVMRFMTNEKEGIQKTLEPTSLLSAMWYQFFLAQAGEIRLKRCSICGKWEDMEGHRESWRKHANCANYDRVRRARLKKKGSLSEE